MGISCTHWGALASGDNCRQTNSRTFDGVMPAPIQAFEERVLRESFRTNLSDWEAHPRYHAYHLVNVLRGHTTLTLGAVWVEYAKRPAPTLTARSRPIVG